MKKFLWIFLPVVMLVNGCDSVQTPPPLSAPTTDSTPQTVSSPSPIQLPAGYGYDGGWYQLYFTNPESPLAPQRTGGVDGPIAASIDSARLSVDVAIYSLSLNSVRDALLRAHDRGVNVRMVMESDNMDRADVQILKSAGIPILGDRREGLMHDKFIIIDNSEVWVGSMNLTDSGAYEDNNNMIHIRSVKMAENYKKEFDEMFVDDKFGDRIAAETPHPRLILDGTPIDTYFSPDDGILPVFVEMVENAESSISFMAFSFTSDQIGEAVRRRAEEGVLVSGVMEDEQVNSNTGTEFDPFLQARLDVRRDGNEGQMHHKVMIIDRQIVIFGSYNFTNSAETRNDETLLVIYNQDIAAQFLEEFGRVYARAR